MARLVTSRRFGPEGLVVISAMLILMLVVVEAVWAVSGIVRAVVLVVLALLALGGALASVAARPEHVQARLSHQILEIANESLSYLRQGLNPVTAGAVCRVALRETDAAAVAITDRDTVLGFAGVGEDHHVPGGPIITRATIESIELNESRVLSTKADIGCPDPYCALHAAVVVPLEMRGEPVGTLKFYYTEPNLLTETQISMAEGLARLLSTQLALAELEKQRELAYSMELKALQSQINPHFLFNTINTIAMFIRTDPTEARGLLREFAAFYRRMLENNAELVPLERELEYTKSYVMLERARFGDRLDVTFEAARDTLGILVPSFAVQPIVENAVKHAMPSSGILHVRVTGELRDSTLLVAVADDGVGIPADDLDRVMLPGFGKGLGIALKNVDDRLKGHFGPDSGLFIESEVGKGTTVRLVMRTSPVTASEGDDDAQSTGL